MKVIINYLPNRYQVALLNDYGESVKIAALDAKILAKLSMGYYITYTLLGHKMIDVEIVQTPQVLGQESLRFLHQVLELCLIIVPVGQVQIDVANLLKLLLSLDLNSLSLLHNRLFICQLLQVTGFYPNLKIDEYSLIKQINFTNNFPENFINFKSTPQMDYFLINWIKTFVNSHVSYRSIPLFATVY